MNKEQVDKWCKDNYGFTIDEADENIGWAMNRLHKYEQEINFLRERENKLQMIEQMFKNKQVDLGDLVALVEGE